MNQVEAQKKWYRCQSQTPLHELLPQPVYREQGNYTFGKKVRAVAKADMLFFVEKIEAKASRFVLSSGGI